MDRRKFLGAAAAGSLALAAVAALGGCSLDEGRLAAFSEDGLSFRYPEGWYVTGFSTTNSPRRLAVASYPVPDDAVEGDCGGYRAVERMPNDGAIVILVDYGRAGMFADRPEVFRLDDGELAEYGCFGASTMFRFGVDGRDLQTHVSFGPEASEAMRDRALAILDSLTIEEPARIQPAQPHREVEGSRRRERDRSPRAPDRCAS